MFSARGPPLRPVPALIFLAPSLRLPRDILEAPEEEEESEGPPREQDLKEAYIQLVRGAQEWQDGCVYQGDFGLDMKLGYGEFSWPTGEVGGFRGCPLPGPGCLFSSKRGVRQTCPSPAGRVLGLCLFYLPETSREKHSHRCPGSHMQLAWAFPGCGLGRVTYDKFSFWATVQKLQTTAWSCMSVGEIALYLRLKRREGSF